MFTQFQNRWHIVVLLYFIVTNILTAQAQMQPILNFSRTTLQYKIQYIGAAVPLINGVPIVVGDELGVSTQRGLCVGSYVWPRYPSPVFFIYGNDRPGGSTPNGLQAGDTLKFAIAQRSSNRIFQANPVIVNPQDNPVWPPPNTTATIEVIFWHANGTGTPTSVSMETTSAIQMKLTPQPVRDQATLDFTTPFAEIVNVEMYDILGRLVGSQSQSFLASGHHTLPFSVAYLPNGCYIVKVTIGSLAQFLPMMIIH